MDILHLINHIIKCVSCIVVITIARSPRLKLLYCKYHDIIM